MTAGSKTLPSQQAVPPSLSGTAKSSANGFTKNAMIIAF